MTRLERAWRQWARSRGLLKQERSVDRKNGKIDVINQSALGLDPMETYDLAIEAFVAGYMVGQKSKKV